MAKRWLWRGLIFLAAGALAACGGSSGPAPICGPQVCVTDVRFLQPEATTISLLFQLTEPDGSVDEANPPTFADGLTITLADESGDQVFLNNARYNEGDFTCLAGTNIPGLEGTLAAACMIALDASRFDPPPASGDAILITFSSPTFPGVLREIPFP